MVSSSLIDRVAHRPGAQIGGSAGGVQVVRGWADWRYAGIRRTRRARERRSCATGGPVWTTDKDGLILGLLSAEIIAKTGRDPAEHHQALTAEFGEMVYERTDMPATAEEKAALGKLSPAQVQDAEVAGEKIIAKFSEAPGNGAPIGGNQGGH